LSDDPSEGPDDPGSGRETEPEPTPDPDGAPPAVAAESAPAEAGLASPPDLADALEHPDSSATEAFHQRARLAEDRLTEVLAAYRSLKGETEAHRDRITRNVERRYEQRRERLLLKFIDILDNMDRALEAAETSYAGEPMIEGLILVRTQLLQTLQEEGLERIPVIGLPYDPNFSEAVETREVEDPDHNGLVVKELLRGYRLNGKIARASKVVIGSFPAAGAKPTSAAAANPADPVMIEDPKGPEEGPSLDDIISRAEAREALFPDAFTVQREADEAKPAAPATMTEAIAHKDETEG
jgi:molecular chaperone GrpE